MNATVVLLWVTRVLTGLALLATVAALALHIRPIEYTSLGDGTASLGTISATWPAVVTFAGIAVAFGALTVFLRRSARRPMPRRGR